MDSIMSYGSSISTVLGNDINLIASTPLLKLVTCGGSEGVSSSQEN